MISRLQVKTSEADQSKRPGGTAILCTPDQTFELRHLQSSNVLHLLEPSDDPTNETTGTRAGLSLAAQCDGLLELVPVTPNAHLYLAQQLPDLAKDREALDQGLPTAASKAQACRVAPFSQAEFERAWQDVCACEVDGQAYVPRASGLKIAWESLGLAATAEGIDLGRQFRTEDLLQGTGDQAVPKEVLLAVLQRVGSSDEGHTDGCLLGLAFSKMPDAKHVIGMRVDRDKCIEWTGAMLLECLDAPVTTTDFIKQWQAVLPEAWEALGTLATLQVGRRVLLQLTADKRGRADIKSSMVVLSSHSKPMGMEH